MKHDGFEVEVARLAQAIYADEIVSGGLAAASGGRSRRVAGLSREEVDAALSTASEQIKSPAIKDVICRALNSVSGDLKEGTKLAAAGLLPLALSGAIPMDPLLAASLIVVVLRAGVSAICGRAEKTRE